MIVVLVGLYHIAIFTKMVVKLYGMYPLTLVKMATSHVVASILMRSSVKVEASHMVAI